MPTCKRLVRVSVCGGESEGYTQDAPGEERGVACVMVVVLVDLSRRRWNQCRDAGVGAEDVSFMCAGMGGERRDRVGSNAGGSHGSWSRAWHGHVHGVEAVSHETSG